jgi:hypothetical protein
MKGYAICFGLVWFFLSPSAIAEGIFVGLKYSSHNLPSGCKPIGGGGWSGGLEEVVLVRACENKIYISLDRLTHRDNKGIPYWEIIAVDTLPTLRKGERISNEADGCSNLNGGSTVVIGTWTANKEKTYASNISYAIKWSKETLKFETIDPKLATCEFDDDRN